MSAPLSTRGRSKHRTRPSPDFPYYAGDPVRISGKGWLIVMVALAAAFAQLELLTFETSPANFIPAVIFAGLPLATLMAMTGWRSPALFRRFGPSGFLAGLGFALLTITSSIVVGLILSNFTDLTPNASVADLAVGGPLDLIIFLGCTFIQLIGEELITILPLLAVMWLCVARLGLSRRRALVIAFVVSTLLFAALHLPTYDWNFVQCFGTIGTARVVLTLAYVVTRNLWVSATAHVANDWSLFLMSFIGGHLPMGTDAPV